MNRRQQCLLRYGLPLFIVYCFGRITLYHRIFNPKTWSYDSFSILAFKNHNNNQSSTAAGLIINNYTLGDDDDDYDDDDLAHLSSSASSKEEEEEELTIFPDVFSRSDFGVVGDDIMQQRHSPLCRPNLGVAPQNIKNIKRIFFGHMRKAGGTTIKSYLGKVARAYNWSKVSMEGRPFEIPGTRNDTLYVTHIRDPIERTISHYKYDQRWNCKDLVRKSFVPSLENELPFDTWFHRGNCPKKKKTKKSFGRIWTCIYNCYIRWLVNPYDNCDKYSKNITNRYIATIESMYNEARKRAFNFNIIIRTEFLRDPNYTDAIERMFGVKGLTGKTGRIYCVPGSKAANALVPPRIRNETLQELRNVSKPDIKLFNELVTCPEGIQFPNTTLDMFQTPNLYATKKKKTKKRKKRNKKKDS